MSIILCNDWNCWGRRYAIAARSLAITVRRRWRCTRTEITPARRGRDVLQQVPCRETGKNWWTRTRNSNLYTRVHDPRAYTLVHTPPPTYRSPLATATRVSKSSRQILVSIDCPHRPANRIAPYASCPGLSLDHSIAGGPLSRGRRRWGRLGPSQTPRTAVSTIYLYL